MNMMDGPKFRRKHRSAAGKPRPAPESVPETLPETLPESVPKNLPEIAPETAPEPPVPDPEAGARRTAEAQARAEEKARRKAEFERIAREEALRRVAAARARREAEARQKAEAEAAEKARTEAEDAARKAEEARLAEERRKAEDAARKAEEARLAEERRKVEDAARKAEEARLAEERRKAEDAARKAQEARQAEERRKAEDAARKAQEARLAEERRKAEDAARKAQEARLADERRKAEAARKSETAAAATAAPYRLTGEDAVAPSPSPSPDAPPVDDTWAQLQEITVDAAHLRRNRIVTGDRDDPAHTVFDVLRTRLLQGLHDNGWKRVAITSPGKDCGKTFTAANLAISLSRQENCRTLLMDFDMRRPNLHKILGIERPGSVGDMLRGQTAPEDHLRRMGQNPVNAGRNIAFALNDTTEAYASELLQDPRTEETLQRIEQHLAPDVMLFDLPPALFYDDVIAFRPLFDGVLLVIGGGLTTQKEIAEVERRLGDSTPLLGLVLNKAEGTELERYSY
ncbi:CpsD/CapB family tyrosine-protein kinase [Maliponia aquimaris]|uniref:Tyrosine-protein kinase YwqD n=1 Tax=Maliponia aquimaris TaxID=1673631 RepID=A0A238JQI6_9RHOB|nr:CpsD/CapB family tyrosine-protein kinase [Maliponia aquimaris]SMX32920.1 Tyrosine-protein kinase YwqD [Maliponia aquimaris]